MKLLISILLIGFTAVVFAAPHSESTDFGTIVGIETRDWGLHIQTDFSTRDMSDCPATAGSTYMYDFVYSSHYNGESASDEVSVLLATYASGGKVAFHIYECNSGGNRPLIGFIRLKK
jgi:hypothetical protein